MRKTKVRPYKKRDGTVVKSHSRTVHRPVDGDTIFVKRKVRGSNYIRPIGYDTPERGEKNYKKATRQLGSLIKGKRLHIEPVAIRRGRVIAKVKAGRKSVTKQMKRNGY